MSLKQKAITGAVCSVMAILSIVSDKAPALHVSKQGLEHIANMEGCRQKAYQCSANVWTVGLGHTGGVKAGDQITLEQAADYFIEDVSKAEKVVISAIDHHPKQGEFDMMVSFVFHLGSGNFNRSTLLRKFNAQQNKQACNEYLRWVYVNGKDCRIDENNCGGIVSRRKKERLICLFGWTEERRK